MSANLPRVLLIGWVLSLLAACGDDSDDAVAVNQATTVSQVSVTSTREAPATVSFELADPEDDPATVELVFFRPGVGTPQSLTLVGAPVLVDLPASGSGTPYTFQWDFGADLGSQLEQGLQVRVNIVDGVQSIVSTAIAGNVSVGNDPPEVVDLPAVAGPVTGVASIPYRIADSSGDPVTVKIEYDVVGDVPDAGFRLARPAGLPAFAPTPEFVWIGIEALASGVDLTFLWDVPFDEGSTDFEAVLRVTLDDGLLPSLPKLGPPVVLDNNASASLESLAVTDTRESPAEVSFLLRDDESDPQRVALTFTRPGSSVPEPMTLVVAGSDENLGTAPGGTPHTVLWDFGADLGSTGFASGFGAGASVLESTTVVASASAPTFDLGNDAPRVTGLFTPPANEVTGSFDFSITVADSSGDPVNVAVEYDVLGDEPDAGFQSARPVGLAPSDPTPEFAVEGFVADPGGAVLDFVWDVVADLGATDTTAVLRFRVEDDLVAGAPVTSGPVALDNNASARTEIDLAAIAGNTDGRRGVPLSLVVSDDESDRVVVALQWRTQAGDFPELPDDPEAVRAALADPLTRRELQLAREYRPRFTGRARTLAPALDPDSDRLGLPELGGPAAGALATGVVGRRLELLRAPGVPVPSGLPFDLAEVVDVLPEGAGSTALVLDSQAAGSWRLRELDLATGALVRLVASGAEGTPLALDRRRGTSTGLLVAVGDGAAWSVIEVDALSGGTAVRVPASAAPVAGTVRSLLGHGPDAAFLTVADALVRLDLAAGSAAVLRRGLSEPWGLALDPTRSDRLFVTQAGGGAPGLATFDLVTHLLRAIAPDAIGPARDLAATADGTRLALVADRDAGDGTFELVAIDLGVPSGLVATELIAGLPSGASRVALGPDDLVLLTHPAQSDLGVAGGLAQVRRVVDYQPRGQVARVDRPFDPAPTNGQVWRLREGFDDWPAVPLGTPGTFVWDSSDVAAGGAVVLRGVALDTDVGLEGDEVALPQLVRGPLDVEPTTSPALLGAAFRDFVEDDLDGDGDVDLAFVSGDANVSIATQVTPGTFVSGAVLDLPSGAEAAAVRSADLDGDGAVDLVVGSRTGGLFAFRREATGFAPVVVELSTTRVAALVLADFDGDGAPDLAAAHPEEDRVLVLRGPLLGGSVPASQELTDSIDGPGELLAADLDRDGLVDLAVANRTGATIALFPGALSGLSSLPTRVLPAPPGATPTALAATDVDGDGRRDLAVAWSGLDRVGFFLAQFDGSFAEAAELLGSAGTTADPADLLAVDLDGDGDEDLALASASLSDVAVFLRAGRAGFGTLPDLALGGPADTGGALALAATDLDRDGRTDLLVARATDERLDVHHPSRPGDFRSEALLLADPLVEEDAHFVQPGDFDGDGDLDLAFANRPENHVTLWLQTSPGAYEPAAGGPIGTGELDAVTALAVGDLDDDGDLDLAAAMTGRSQVGLLYQGAPGELELDPATGVLGSFPFRFRPRSVAVGDLDGDGDLDVVAANTGNGSLSVFLQDSGAFPQAPAFNLSSGQFTQRPNVVLAVDVDADGDTDIVTANQGNKFDPDRAGVTVFLQEGGTFDPAPQVVLVNLEPGTEVLDVACGDLDQDGDLDLVLADAGAGALLVIEQLAPGTFVYGGRKLTVPGEAIAPSSVEVADLDGDQDVAFVDGASGRVLVFVQSAPGVFHVDPLVELRPLAPGGVTLGLAAADLDSDGDVDLVTADSVGGAQTLHFGGR